MMKNLNEKMKTFSLAILLSLGLNLFISAGLLAQNLPAGTVDGINYIDDNTVVLVLLAPNKGSAYATGDFNNWGKTYMNKTPDGKRFWVQLNNLVAGEEYIYQYVVDESVRISDPFAEKILDPNHDSKIPSSTYPGLIPWTDKSKGQASVFQTAQPEYQWKVNDFKGPLLHHLVAYELLLRDFTPERNFQSVIDSIKYFKKLGINAIELCPVNEFDNNLSWGYNPSHYFAVDKFYGPKNKLKELVDVAHQNGIAVILDVVYNHSYGQSPLLRLYQDPNTLKPTSDNPWYNVDAPHTKVAYGYDFDHTSSYTQEFFDRVSKFWLEEYKIDGYRFDFTKGLTQKYSTDWDGLNGYDSQRVGIVKRMADKVWEIKNDAYVILEHWAGDQEENELTAYGKGMLTWRKVHGEFTNAIKGEKLWETYFGGAQSDTRMVFMESHDEERIPYETMEKFHNEKTVTDRMKLGAAFLYTVPGPKMIWMFEELACDYSLYTCEDGSYSFNDDCKLAVKPFKWDEYMQSPNRVDVYNTIAGLLKLRSNYDAFTMGHYEIDENGDGEVGNGAGALRQIRIKHDEMDVVILGNFGTDGGSIEPWFTKNGTWYNYFNEDYPTYEYTGQTSYYLAPGQFELFTSIPVGEIIEKPTNLQADESNNIVSLDWTDNADNETGYIVQRSTSSSTGFTTIASLGVDASTFSDSVENGKYYYLVYATGEDSKISDFSNVAPVQVGPVPGITVHFKNTDNWNPVNIYLFDWATKAPLPDWTWPGEAMEQEGTSAWYKFTFVEENQVGIVFNDGGSKKSVDLTRTTDGWYDFGTKQWYDECPGDCPVDPVPVLTVNPGAGTYEDSVVVYLSATNNGVITYTLDGTEPKSGLSAPSSIVIKNSATLRVIAENTVGYSDEFSGYYEITHPVPVLSVNPAGQEFEGSIDVSLSATKNGVITYTLDGTDPKFGDAYDGVLTFTDTTNLRAIASNLNGYSNEINEWYYLVESSCDTIYFYDRYNWGAVKIYLFNADGTGIPGWNWPGVDMTRIGASKWYYFVNCEEGDVGIVFNNGNGQQLDDEFSNGGWFYQDDTWNNNCPGDCPGEPTQMTIYYNNNNTNWGGVNLYFWNTTPASLSTVWPGVQMADPDGDGWFEYTLDGVECANVIFSNYGNNQTDDLYTCGDSYWDNGWVSNPFLKSAKANEIETISNDVVSTLPYPNPFKNEVNFRILKKSNLKLLVMDAKGAIVYSQDLCDKVGEINVNLDVPRGIYFMRLINNSKVNTYKIIKE